ncbi:GIN domain-containing protein [Kaistella antarctica]|uniref:Protein of uncharacterized function (DUF2807) n=1 Tax=Kaistella antarctica TaxID=266748 RepID=A0A3S4V0N1_9FLAO|nr:DUF2807 domain-containing protein [Kaistella antarctica]KEY19443.1 hypothetical protein HY04_13680 [Kaistella antarctica]SEW07076.1 Putative auto-transporter adhesin, head GIN domain [Kaistella antarctica]VEH97467.1 Protein of uncharacterised function (DUF2807) [Kaistella antarctica]
MRNLIYVGLIFSLFSCGKVSPKGEIISKDIKVEEFVNLNLDGKFRAFYIKSDSSFVNVETYKNVGDNLKIKVKDKTLSITESRETEGVDFYNVTIYSKYNLEKVSMTQTSELNISSEIKTDNFRLNLKNSAKFIGSVNSRRAEIDMTEKSRANFLGKTKDVILKISDTASLIAPYWMIDHLKIESKNGNYAEVNVKDSLKGAVKNTAKLTYYNDPISAIKIEETATVQHQELE